MSEKTLGGLKQKVTESAYSAKRSLCPVCGEQTAELQEGSWEEIASVQEEIMVTRMLVTVVREKSMQIGNTFAR